jgi:hypothetical protein
MSIVADVLEAHPEVKHTHTTIFGTEIYTTPDGRPVLHDYGTHVAVHDRTGWSYHSERQQK